jgi:hypothetical protein
MMPPGPFELPPATGGRFGLLVLGTIASSSYLYSWIAGHTPFVDSAGKYCADQAGAAAPGVGADLLVGWYAGCARWTSLHEAVVVGAMLVLLMAGVLLHYLLAPVIKARQFESLAPPPHIAEAGFTDRVQIYVDHVHTANTHVFGRMGRYCLVLGAKDLAPENAPIVAHELGHLRNRDVDFTALSTAVWWAFLGLAALPALACALTDIGALSYYALRLPVLLALVYSLHCLVIRTREFYADLRAVESGATGLMDALERRQSEGARRRGIQNLWARRFHPSHGARVAMVKNQRPLFRVNLAPALSAGILVGLAYRPGYHFASIAWPSSVFGKDIGCGVLLGGLAAAALAGSSWRSALWARRTGEHAHTEMAAFAFAASLLLGDAVAPAVPGTESWLVAASRSPWQGLTVAAVLVLGVHLFLRWMVASAATRVVGSGARRAYHVGLVIAALVGGIWLGFWFRLADIFQLDPGWRAIAFALGTSAVLPVPLIAVWLAGTYTAGTMSDTRADRDWHAPWVLGYAFAAGVLVTYAVALAADHTAIGAAIQAAGNTPASLVPVAYLLYAPAVVIAVAGGLAAGLCHGGRRSGQLIAVLVGLLPMLAAALFLTSLAYVVALDGLDRSFLTLVTGMGKLPGADATDQPAYASLGITILALAALLMLTSCPAAWLGATVRRHLSIGLRQVNGRRPRRTALLLLPSVLITALVGVLGLREWSVAVSTTNLRLDYDTTGVQLAADRVRVGTVHRDEACRRLYANGTMFPLETSADAGAAAHLAGLAALGMSSDDLVMQRLGEGSLALLNLRELTAGGEAVGNLLRYCTATEGDS